MVCEEPGRAFGEMTSKVCVCVGGANKSEFSPQEEFGGIG